MLSILSDTEKAIVETITKGLLPEPALQYLEDVGFKMSRATYFRHKKKIEETKQERMQFIANNFQELHLEKIDRLELIDKLMWEQFDKEGQPYRKVKILESIANLQPFLTSFYESTTIAIDISKKFNGNSQKMEPLSFNDWFSDYCSNNWNLPRIGDESDEKNGNYYRDLQRRYNDYKVEWEWRNGFREGPRPSLDTESEAWTDKPVIPKSIEPIPSPKVESEQEVKPEIIGSLNKVTEPVIEEKETIQKPETGFYQTWKLKSKDTIDVDLLGYSPKPFDVSDTWVQCKIHDCNKWFKNKEIRQEHAAKYHV